MKFSLFIMESPYLNLARAYTNDLDPAQTTLFANQPPLYFILPNPG